MTNRRFAQLLVGLLSVTLLALGPAAAAGAAPPAGQGGGGDVAATVIGYDVSYPQCDQGLPSAAPFATVGVNGGLAYSDNPCLASQYDWALTGATSSQVGRAGPGVMLYVNTGNPGPVASSRWPAGQNWPRPCDGTWSEDCAYDYGWNAASEAFGVAERTLPYGAASSATWWLDVETANSWNHDDLDTNVAALRGFRDLLRLRAPAHEVGIYSTGYQWGLITGATSPGSPRNLPFLEVPNWVAGATANTAASFCNDTFTGGPVRFVQYVQSGLDHDRMC
jgi:hypothetical protein